MLMMPLWRRRWLWFPTHDDDNMSHFRKLPYDDDVVLNEVAVLSNSSKLCCCRCRSCRRSVLKGRYEVIILHTFLKIEVYVCMCVCMYMCVYYICQYVCVCIMYVYVCICVCITYVCMYVCMYVCVLCLCMYVCVLCYICVCMCVWILFF